MEIMPRLLARLGGRFAAELGLDLKSGPEARQQWFLAAMLYGAPISGQLAARTYRVLAARGVYKPSAILAQGWDNLVALLDEGGYARYDFKTASKLLRVMESLTRDYQGSLERLHQVSRDCPDLEQRLQSLAPGIGPATVNIFLRELRGVWAKATPPLGPLARLAGEHLKLLAGDLTPEEALEALAARWRTQPAPGWEFADLEAALVRLGRDFCRKDHGPPCPMGADCGRERKTHMGVHNQV
jgi:endonuclease III